MSGSPAQKRAFPKVRSAWLPRCGSRDRPRCGPAPRASGVRRAKAQGLRTRPGPRRLPARRRRRPGTLAGEGRGSAVAQRPHCHRCSEPAGQTVGQAEAGRGKPGRPRRPDGRGWGEERAAPARGMKDAGRPRGEKEVTECPSRPAPPLTRSADERCHRQPEEDGGRGAAEEGAAEGVRAGRRRCCLGSGLQSPRRRGDDTTAGLRAALPV